MMLKSTIFVLVSLFIIQCSQAWKFVKPSFAPVQQRHKDAIDSPVLSGKKLFGAIATSLFLLSASPNLPAFAANYGGFGSTYSEVVSPKDAVFNDETKSSDEVKAGREGLETLLKTVSLIKADLSNNNQIELQQRIKSELNISKVREVLNKYNGAFAEDTQRGTDRLIRNAIQYLTELDREAGVKAGKARSDVKTATVTKTLNALEAAFNDLKAFYPAN